MIALIATVYQALICNQRMVRICHWHVTGGMVGELLAPGGEVCPMVVPAPFKVGQDITTNGVCCAAFRNLPHQRHTSRPLPDQSLEVSLAVLLLVSCSYACHPKWLWPV